MNAEDFVRLIISESPIWPYDDYNACHFCGATWAEDRFDLWLNRESSATRPDWIRDHHDRDCIWVLAHQVEGAVVS